MQNELFLGPLRILDVGAGSGRDAAFFATERLGNWVLTVEPAKALTSFGKRFPQGLPVTWHNDTLPELADVEDKY
ncbi:hypothetical protein TUM3811_28050 [Shewanella algae]|nr:hypothetical protein TUM3811_28050 [Shewanella algae]